MSPSKSKTSLHKFAIGGTESENDSEVGQEKEQVETGQNIAKDTIEDNKARKNSSNCNGLKSKNVKKFENQTQTDLF